MQQRGRRSGFIIGPVVLGVLALTASPAQAASGVGPYYAELAWDRKLPAATRFLVLTNWSSEAVLDKETGLVWERSPSTTLFTRGGALGACAGLTTGNRKGWRLPSIHQLASLIDPMQGNPALPLGHPFLNVVGVGGTGEVTLYWSATTKADNPTTNPAALVWRISLSDGAVDTGPGISVGQGDQDAPKMHAWCVRSGLNR